MTDSLTPTALARVGFFTLWSHEVAAVAGQPTRICRNYVHSKVAIIDDLWATVGSANLDGDSLSFSQNADRGVYRFFGGLLGLRQHGVVTDNRESETNLVVYNGIDGQPTSTFPGDLRRRLWAEHLSFLSNGEPDLAALTTKPVNGWLDLWTTRANAKLAGLTAATPTVHDARVLPYPVPPLPRYAPRSSSSKTMASTSSRTPSWTSWTRAASMKHWLHVTDSSKNSPMSSMASRDRA